MHRPTDTERLYLTNRLRSIRYLAETAMVKLTSHNDLPPEYVNTINDLARMLESVSKQTDAIIQRGMDALADTAPKMEDIQK